MAQTSDVFGYVLMENDNTFKEVTNLNVFKNEYLFYVRFDTILQSLDCLNRNKRFYKGDAVVASLSTPEIQELIANNKFKGEAGHPIDGSVRRVATVDPKYTCHRIIKWWRDDNLIRGTVETLDDGLYGTKLTKSILQNENPSFSYRALAVLEKKGSVTYVNKPPRCIAYDEVNLPSHKEAYADPKKIKVAQNYAGQETTMESANSGIDLSRAVTGSEIAEMVINRSTNLQMVCESFDIDPKSISAVNGNQVSLKHNGNTFVFPLETKIARDIAGYWGRMK